ncbi:hypothetical protein ACHAW5_002263 [Stephanodiscus triporus]|uniref:Uncharacterized protein n=1 Tax=Stephanodiscus triporus TaxID=2934178 RepID=A0ABD3MIR2_9STRA
MHSPSSPPSSSTMPALPLLVVAIIAAAVGAGTDAFSCPFSPPSHVATGTTPPIRPPATRASSSSSSSLSLASPPSRLVVVVDRRQQQQQQQRRRRRFVRVGPLRSSSSSSSSDEGPRLFLPYYERLMENIPPSNVVDAVEEADGKPIAASDLSASAGISLASARKELTTLAALTGGDIAVGADGELTYAFPKDARGAISRNSAKYRAMRLWSDKVYPPLLYATKLGFGVVLFASLIAIFSTIFFVLSSGGGGSSSSDREDDRRDGRRSMGGGGGMPPMMGGFWGPSPFDFFYYRPYYSGYYNTPSNGDGRRRRGRGSSDEMGFLESVFSYVFGDGNPNGDVEERRLTLAASMIRENGGAVTAEQLAPYCDDAPMPPRADGGGKLGEERAYVDESFVLPIVTQLDGEPRVTDEGDIVYVFPELMTSASATAVGTTTSGASSKGGTSRTTRESRILRRAGLDEDAPTSMIGRLLNVNGISTRGALERADLVDMLERALPDEKDDEFANDDVDDPSMLLEREFKFSLASSFQTALAGLLGVVNLGGALYLGNLLGQYATYGVRLPSYMGLVQQFFPFLLGYAVLFNAVPLGRNFWIKSQNEKIRRRNESRRSWRAVLEGKAGGVGRKLLSAARFGKRMRQLGPGGESDIVFDTSKGLDELDKVREREAMKDFDKVLDGKESSWE